MAPTHRLVGAALVAVLVAAAALWIALSQPYLGLDLAANNAERGLTVRSSMGPARSIPEGAILSSVAGASERLRLQPLDRVPEPNGSLRTFDDYRVLLDRQDILSRIQHSDAVTFTDVGGSSWTIKPAPNRPLGSLHPDFWIQIAVGMLSWLISVSIWAFRSGETSARYLLLSGFATLIFAPSAAVYTTRELALPANLFLVLSDLNFLTFSLFAAALVAMLLYYPRKIAPRWAGVALILSVTLWFLVQEASVFVEGPFKDMLFARRALVAAALVFTFVATGVHWRLTGADPLGRAALQWFLISWLVGVTAFFVGIVLPQLAGVDTSTYQGYSFLFVLLIYIGLAFGIIRFRLFQLGEWWVGIVAWSASVTILVAVDVLFFVGLNLSSRLSLSLSVIISALAWLPLHGWLWTSFWGRTDENERARFETVMAVGFDPDREARKSRWVALLRRLFNPLNLNETDQFSASEVLDDGVTLAIPAIDTIPGFSMQYAWGGRRLFTRKDAALADDVIGMLRHVINSRTAYDKGVTFERQRIASDLHDNLGAPLLSALHAADGARKNELIRESLADLRSIVNPPPGAGASLEEALAEIRYEAVDRLEAAGLTIDWPRKTTGPASLSPAVVYALRSVVREAVSNIIKHSGAHSVRVTTRLFKDTVEVVVEDDGLGFDPDAVDAGHGLSSIQTRVASRGGEVAWLPGSGGKGCRMVIAMPVGA